MTALVLIATGAVILLISVWLLFVYDVILYDEPPRVLTKWEIACLIPTIIGVMIVVAGMLTFLFGTQILLGTFIVEADIGLMTVAGYLINGRLTDQDLYKWKLQKWYVGFKMPTRNTGLLSQN